MKHYFKDLNDEIEDAREPALFTKAPLCDEDDEYNPLMFANFKANNIRIACQHLKVKNDCNIQKSKDIDAACGQLANKLAKQYPL